MTGGMTAPDGGWRSAIPTTGRGKRRRPGGGWGGGRRGGETPMVEDVEFTSYYGRPIIKPPVWKSPEVPLYLFLGGAAGTSSVLGALGEFTGRRRMARSAHYFAAGGALGSVVLLIVDLGRPERFLHMLRVFKPTSPLSVGSYILSPFSALTTATAGLHLLGWFPRLRPAVGALAGLFGAPMTTYTAVLFANTAVPSWHEFHERLPYVFAGSAMGAGGGITMALSPVYEAGPARKMAVTGAAIEMAAMHRLENDPRLASEPYRVGRAGKLMRAARACTGSGAALTVFVGRTRLGAIASGTLLAAGSLLTRFGVYEAGMASVRDPKYTVVPQRERLATRQNGHAPTVTT
jgi:energy-converting hydrogenase Eha subunit A